MSLDMGLYPLLEDETCWLLAVDFDKGTYDAPGGLDTPDEFA